MAEKHAEFERVGFASGNEKKASTRQEGSRLHLATGGWPAKIKIVLGNGK